MNTSSLIKPLTLYSPSLISNKLEEETCANTKVITSTPGSLPSNNGTKTPPLPLQPPNANKGLLTSSSSESLGKFSLSSFASLKEKTPVNPPSMKKQMNGYLVEDVYGSSEDEPRVRVDTNNNEKLKTTLPSTKIPTHHESSSSSSSSLTSKLFLTLKLFYSSRGEILVEMEPMPTTASSNPLDTQKTNLILRHETTPDVKLTTTPPILLRPYATNIKHTQATSSIPETSLSGNTHVKSETFNLPSKTNTNTNTNEHISSSSIADKWLEHHKKLRRNLIQEYFTSTGQSLPLQTTTTTTTKISNEDNEEVLNSRKKYGEQYNWDMELDTTKDYTGNEDNENNNMFEYRRRVGYGVEHYNNYESSNDEE